MTQEEIKNLKEGDIITWLRKEKGWQAFGRIQEAGTLFCDYIIGDGDSQIGREDIFVSSEPGWVDEGEISFVSPDDYVTHAYVVAAIEGDPLPDKLARLRKKYLNEVEQEDLDACAIFEVGFNEGYEFAMKTKNR